jgi:hypothetical protein
MSKPEANISALIDKITQLTKQGAIRWHRRSPTAYSTTRPTATGKKYIAIQKSSSASLPSGRMVKKGGILLEVGHHPAGVFEPEVIIDTREREDLAVSLEQLFDAAQDSVDSGIADVLRELIA